jgi:DMSO/TMAO reductase YedYZ molybdopterin-dependent catalytic subunit
MGAVVGFLAAAVALVVGELVSALAGSDTSPVTAVGTVFIDEFAASLKDLAIALFGTNDKPALVTGVVLVSLLLGTVLGIASVRRRWILPVGVVLFGGVGVWAIVTDPLGSWTVAIVMAVPATLAGIATATGLFAVADRSTPTESTEATDVGINRDPRVKAADRRGFLVASGATAVGAGAAFVLARAWRPDASVPSVADVALPTPSATLRVPSSGAFTDPGLTPFITPNADFYRIDTALRAPRVDSSSWSLKLSGLVDDEFSIDYAELLAMDSVSVPVTIQCVSNEVGGDLIGTAVWQGVPLAALLDRAGVRGDAEQVVGRSVDGFTAGFPLADARDGRTAVVAYAMNGEPLPRDHGYPARLVVAGLYGYVSATKWLESIELTTWDAFDGYWVPRGWSKTGPIKTASRIDVPSGPVPAGDVAVAGVAWAPARGISRVELQVDDGDWVECELAASASDETWVQWRYVWSAESGSHRLRVRATDGAGAIQTAEVAPPAPDGASGHHTRNVRVG